LVRVYSEWMTGDAAWALQVCTDCIACQISSLQISLQDKLPPDATLLGVILSSDKTNISALTGDRAAHPLLIGLANIHMNTRMKSSSNALLLTALLPIPKFIHKNKRMRGMLTDRLIHEALDIVLEPLKAAAAAGIMMADPYGYNRYCFTPAASYMVDTPEACMLSCVGGKTSPVTTAKYKEFGDNIRHPSRTAEMTLTQLASIEVPPSDLERYFQAAQQFRLNGVDKPFWRDWALADPSIFLTPEPLHHWHTAFWAHDVRWAICIVGATEFDFRFSVLQPSTGFRHFPEGISQLKKVTGRTYRDVQRYLVGVIADIAPRGVVTAIRALMDFRYLAQAPIIDDEGCNAITTALNTFHAHKHAITDAGGRRGKREPLTHWQIPKLELLQSVVPSIKQSGVPEQWSADLTEHAHITMIKNPARSSNNNNYDPQICRSLDRTERCFRFELATSLRENEHQLDPEDGNLLISNSDDANSDSDDDDDDEKRLYRAVTSLGNPTRGTTDYFSKSYKLQNRHTSCPAPYPPRSFVAHSTAFNLARDPKCTRILVDEAAELHNIPDLRSALGDYLLCVQQSSDGTRTIGG